KDAQAAEDMLKALAAKPQITDAQLRLKDGTLFANYGKTTTWAPAPVAGARFESGDLIYSEPVILDNEQIGFLHLRSDYQSELRDQITVYAGILALVLTIVVVMTTVLTAKLQRVISTPILRLAEAAKVVAEKK